MHSWLRCNEHSVKGVPLSRPHRSMGHIKFGFSDVTLRADKVWLVDNKATACQRYAALRRDRYRPRLTTYRDISSIHDGNKDMTKEEACLILISNVFGRQKSRWAMVGVTVRCVLTRRISSRLAFVFCDWHSTFPFRTGSNSIRRNSQTTTPPPVRPVGSAESGMVCKSRMH